MMIGFFTMSIRILVNVTRETEPEPPCQVLILRPLSEFLISEFETVMLETHARVFRRPKLPMLHYMDADHHQIDEKFSNDKETEYLMP